MGKAIVNRAVTIGDLVRDEENVYVEIDELNKEIILNVSGKNIVVMKAEEFIVNGEVTKDINKVYEGFSEFIAAMNKQV